MTNKLAFNHVTVEAPNPLPGSFSHVARNPVKVWHGDTINRSGHSGLESDHWALRPPKVFQKGKTSTINGARRPGAL